MRRLSLIIGFSLFLAALGSKAEAGNYVIYLQGRGWGSWNGEVANSPGWTNVTMSYDGSSRLDSAATNVTVRNAIGAYCAGGNYCVIECYSAGCLRMLKAVNDLHAGGNSTPGLLWAEGAASAAGGTKLAEVSTKGFTGFIAKILGQQEKVDYDLTPSAARSTYGYVQGSMGAYVYHIAGAKNFCKKILFVKICGNKYVDALVGDGVVGMDSASGASAQGKYSDGCAVAKYPYRTYDSWYSPCGGDGNRDHFGMPGSAATILSSCLGGSGYDANRTWHDPSSDSVGECTDSAGQCDNAFDSGAADYSKTPALVSVATDVSASASNTTGYTNAGTCSGKCGHYGGSCWCDSYCVTYGDCCGDYYAAQCNILNAP